MKNNIVLTGDIEKSRELNIQDRRKVQDQLQQTLDMIRSERNGLESPPTITLGDEFQAVYRHADNLFNHTWQILENLHPVTVRFSIGIGTITTPVNKEQAIGMDGPAFYASRRGIEELKETGFLYELKTDAKGESSELNLINGILHLISREMRSWNKKRFSVLCRLDSGKTVREIARDLNISKSAVYKNRTDGSLDVIMDIKNNIASFINTRLI